MVHVIYTEWITTIGISDIPGTIKSDKVESKQGTNNPEKPANETIKIEEFINEAKKPEASTQKK